MEDGLNLITLDSLNIDIGAVITTIDSYGICVLRNYVTPSSIMRLLAEHEVSFNSHKSEGIYSIHQHPTNEKGMVARGKTNELGDAFSTTRTIFSSEFMKSVSDQYFGVSSIVCDDVFFTHEKESDVPILPWHFDRQQSLKFFINLVDVDQRNGAFEYDIGSHREGHFRVNYYLLSGVEVGKMPNDIPEAELRNPTTITAKAGDLVIFDPDGFHRGGTIDKDQERKVVRGHSHPVPNIGYKAKLFDAYWWVQSSFNISNLLKNKVARNVPTERLTRARARK